MPNMPQYVADQLLNWYKHTNMVAAPATGYVALMTSSPSLNTAGTEVTGGSYARVAVTMATGWSAISTVNGKRQITNAADIVFVTATADWATDTQPIVGWELRDASTAGNRLAYGDLDEPQPLGNGQTAKFLAGDLVGQVG